MTDASSSHVFDRARLRQRRDRCRPGFAGHAFLFDEVAERIRDRLDDVTRPFARVLDLGARDGRLAARVRGRPGTESVITADPSPAFASALSGLSVAADEDALPFADAAFDLVVSNLSLHWVNDLPGALVQIRRVLKPDGFFCAALLGGDTLIELRRCLVDAELDLLGGASPRVSPFAGVRDLGNLLMRAGFALPVADGDTLTVTYPDPLALLRDLRGMGETAALAGHHRPLRRDVLFEALRRYAEAHSEPDGRVAATFEVIHIAGWSPDASQPKPLKPGSAVQRLADALNAGPA
jgi:NADH dehydrogenase [ubiquinone] 1 alpha subcomplex assembly factor 5